jgi:hypothetical protein
MAERLIRRGARGHNGHVRGSFAFAPVRSVVRMTCKQGLSANGRERVRTLPTLAMQKVVGSSPIIRFTKARSAGCSFSMRARTTGSASETASPKPQRQLPPLARSRVRSGMPTTQETMV